MLESHEILGTDQPIFKEKESKHYTLEDIFNTNQSLESFEKVGFVRFNKFGKTFYKPVYVPKKKDCH